MPPANNRHRAKQNHGDGDGGGVEDGDGDGNEEEDGENGIVMSSSWHFELQNGAYLKERIAA